MFVDPDGRFIPIIAKFGRYAGKSLVRLAKPYVRKATQQCVEFAFRRGGFLHRHFNNGQYFRIGISTKGSRRVFRAAGEYVRRYNKFRGRPDRGDKAIDVDLGPK